MDNMENKKNSNEFEKTPHEEMDVVEFNPDDEIVVDEKPDGAFDDKSDAGEEIAVPGKKKPKKQKVKKNRKKLKHGAAATALTVAFVAALVLINIVATALFDRFPLTLDLTSSDSYSVSDETVDYVKGIDKEVTVTVLALEDDFTSQSKYTLQADEILKKYAQNNSKIKIEYYDFDSNPDIVSKYDDQLSAYDIIFETTNKDSDGKDYLRTSVVSPADLVNFSSDFEQSLEQYYGTSLDQFVEYYGGMSILAAYGSAVESSNAEQAYTSALMAVTDANPVTVTMLTGRNEAASLSYFQKLLKANGYVVNSIDITTQDIPSDTKLVVMGAPTIDYTADEVKKVSDFLDNGGNLNKELLYCESVQQPDTPNIDELLAEYGIKINDKFVYDSSGNNASNGYVAMELSSNNFMEDLKDDSLKLFTTMYTKPVEVLFDEQDMKVCEAYVQTSDTGYTMDENGKEIDSGVIVTAAVGSKAVFVGDTDTNYSNVIALGSEYFLDDTMLEATQALNSDWILSLVNGVTDKTTAGITVEPKQVGGTLFELTNFQIGLLKAVFIGVIPAIVLIIGIVVWVRRRNR